MLPVLFLLPLRLPLLLLVDLAATAADDDDSSTSDAFEILKFVTLIQTIEMVNWS